MIYHNNQVQMSYQHQCIINQEDHDFEIEKAPKRCSYRKIKLNVKEEMIRKHIEEKLSISKLSKLFHLNYSTIAYIIKTYKQKNVIFQPKQSKLMREVKQEQLKNQNIQPQQNQAQEQLKYSVKQQCAHYLVAIYWPYYA